MWYYVREDHTFYDSIYMPQLKEEIYTDRRSLWLSVLGLEEEKETTNWVQCLLL